MNRPFIRSVAHAVTGFARLFKDERNIRIHSIVGVVALLLAFALDFSPIELAIVIMTVSLVITGELFNAALERYSDIIKPRVSGYVEQIKDIAAAAVLVLSLMSLLVGVVLYLPKLIGVMY